MRCHRCGGSSIPTSCTSSSPRAPPDPTSVASATVTTPASLEAAATEGRVLAWFAATEPDRPAVVADRGTLTFAEIDARVNRLVRALRARGITAGDSVALIAPNRAEWVETFAAAQRAGLRITPINFHLGVDEAEYIVRDCGARAVVLDGRLGELAPA